MNKLREELGVRVDFVELGETNKKGGKLSKVTIKGRKENVEEAAKRVKSTANKMVSSPIRIGSLCFENEELTEGLGF